MKKSILILVALVALMLTSLGTMAQGGASPYLNSTHTYTVTMEDGANTASWVIADNAGVALATQPSFSSGKAGKVATMVITWADTWASVGDYKIWFIESGTCSTKRELPISIIANTFYLTMNADGSECHDLSGTILGVDAIGNTNLLFTVNLNKDSDWAIDNWKFDFTVNVSSGYTLQSVKLNAGAELGTSGNYSDQSVPGTLATSIILVVINGHVETGATVTVALSNGKAVKGTTTTPDNGTGDKNQELTVDPLPATSAISAD